MYRIGFDSVKVLLVDKKRIHKYFLPDNLDDSFVISYRPLGSKGECLITFEKSNEHIYLKSNGTVNIFDSNMIVNEALISDYGFYILKILGTNDYVYLYTFPNVEKEVYRLDFNSLNSIKIGNGQKCNIFYQNNLTGPLHAEIKFVDNRWQIVSTDPTKFLVYVNHNRKSQSNLKVGDMIFINGLKIVWMGNFLTVNNPKNKVGVVGLSAHIDKDAITNEQYTPVSDEEKIVELYREEEYFYHIPRIREVIDDEEISIDPPPGEDRIEELPFILTIGTSLTMGASSLMMVYNVVYGLSTGSRTFLAVLPQIVLAFAMIVGSLILPRVATKYQKKKKKEREKLRQEKYGVYLQEKEAKISGIIKKQAQILTDNSISIKDCENIITSRNRNFWSREINDDDFLKVRLGSGDVDASLFIKAPEEHFTLDEDNLLKNVYEMVSKYQKLVNVPINFSLVEKNIAALICNCSYKDKYLDGIILQLATLQSAGDLKIIIFTNEEKEPHWEYTKFLPHCFSEDKITRFFATNEEEMKEISNLLEEEFKKRKAVLTNQDKAEEEIKLEAGYKNFIPYYLIINDDYKTAKNIPIINAILKTDNNFGFSLLVVEETMKELPNKCETFIEIGEKDGCILEKNISSKSQIVFKGEYEDNLDMKRLSSLLANIPIMTKDGVSVLPASLSFLDMYGVSKIEQLNIINRWKVNNPVTNLNAPVGVHANGEQFKLNLHEKAHGPHGLIAGSTGSGKSEFIITYILSMALNYHPYEVQFVLIDYKGGGLAGAFENKETGVRLPHLTGTITNLDTSEMNRTLVSIESELKRRQKQFNKVRDSLGESTIDIYKYQRLYREGIVKEPMAHLFIISDEFAELKSQQPEFMAQLISTARIGRSLGVHLILATQKPSGVVNDQIWSNSKFKVCLKVQDRSDSMEMLKRPEAASIKEVGRFYLQVGYDDYFDIGQSGWAGAKYIPSDKIIKKIDDSIDYINNIGYVTKTIKDMVVSEPQKEYGDQLTNVVKYICNLGKRENIVTTKLWLDAIPSEIFIDDLKKKYNYKPTPYFINPVIGEYDMPANQQQGLLNLDLTHSGNTLIYGQTGSGKENLLMTTIWSSILEHTPEEVNFYIVDCGSESLKTFINMPHVGDIAGVDDEDKIVGMMNMLNDEIERRKDLFVEYAGSYTEYIANSGEKLPLIVTIINNYEIFCENYAKLSESIQNLYRDGSKYGVVFIISAIATNAVRSRMAQNFVNRLALQIPNEIEYRTLLGAPRGLFPAKIFGRGIVSIDKTAFEFQTAYIGDKKELNNIIRQASVQLSKAYTIKAKKIPVVPEVITIDTLKKELKDVTKLPIGYDIVTKEPFVYNFKENKLNMILTNYMDDNKMNFVYALIKELKLLQNHVTIIDMVNAYEKFIENVVCYNKEFDKAIITINNEIIKNNQSPTTNYYIFLGVGEIKNKLTVGKDVLSRLFTSINSITNSYFIFIDTYTSFRTLQTEGWYQLIDKNYGIWLGEDIGSQLSISVNNLTMEDRRINFIGMGFAVVKGKYTIIKHVTDEVTDEK